MNTETYGLRGDEPADATDGANTLLEVIVRVPALSRLRSNPREKDPPSWSVCSSEETGGPFVEKNKKNESAARQQTNDVPSILYMSEGGVERVTRVIL